MKPEDFLLQLIALLLSNNFAKLLVGLLRQRFNLKGIHLNRISSEDWWVITTYLLYTLHKRVYQISSLDSRIGNHVLKVSGSSDSAVPRCLSKVPFCQLDNVSFTSQLKCIMIPLVGFTILPKTQGTDV